MIKKNINLAKPFSLPISKIAEHIAKHYKYSGNPKILLFAIYSVYECLVKETKRFEGKQLMPLEEHTSSDKSSGRVGDIEIRDAKGRVFTEEISKILKIHGCQVIVNGLYPSLKYYLRLLHNTYDFIENYVENLKVDKTIKYEHKLKWNTIVSQSVK